MCGRGLPFNIFIVRIILPCGFHHGIGVIDQFGIDLGDQLRTMCTILIGDHTDHITQFAIRIV